MLWGYTSVYGHTHRAPPRNCGLIPGNFTRSAQLVESWIQNDIKPIAVSNFCDNLMGSQLLLLDPDNLWSSDLKKHS